jgi:hypothetical protein
MKPKEFRTELVKIMPFYDWTVSKTSTEERMVGTGTQSSGFNRLSTLQVIRTDKGADVFYEARSAGHGTRSPWLAAHTDTTLARALRGLQGHYEHMAGQYRAHAAAMQAGRKGRGAKP